MSLSRRDFLKTASALAVIPLAARAGPIAPPATVDPVPLEGEGKYLVNDGTKYVWKELKLGVTVEDSPYGRAMLRAFAKTRRKVHADIFNGLFEGDGG